MHKEVCKIAITKRTTDAPTVYSLHKHTKLQCSSCNIGVLGNNIKLNKKHQIVHIDFSYSLIRQITDSTFMQEALYLDKINLSNNQISELSTGYTFGYLLSLSTLDLSYNFIKYIHPDAFLGLINLKNLFLNNNKLSKILANTFRNIPNLRFLNVAHNMLVELNIAEIKKIDALNACENEVAIVSILNAENVSAANYTRWQCVNL